MCEEYFGRKNKASLQQFTAEYDLKQNFKKLASS